jgi:hypothetical protein
MAASTKSVPLSVVPFVGMTFGQYEERMAFYFMQHDYYYFNGAWFKRCSQLSYVVVRDYNSVTYRGPFHTFAYKEGQFYRDGCVYVQATYYWTAVSIFL